MKAWGSLLGTITMALAVTSHASTLTPVIDSFTLIDLIEDNSVKVLEIRSDEKAYLKQHIPGSVHLSYGEFRGPKTNPGQLPDLQKLAKALGSRGIQVEDAVVIVHDLETLKPLDVYRHEEPVYGVSIHPDNRDMFLTACSDGRVMLYDMRARPGEDPLMIAGIYFAEHSSYSSASSSFSSLPSLTSSF